MALCMSLSAPTLEECKTVLTKYVENLGTDAKSHMVEIRVDLISDHSTSGKGKVSDAELVDLYSFAKELGLRTISTCRDVGDQVGFTELRSTLLSVGIDSGAEFVDLEYEAPVEYRQYIVRRAKEANCQVVVSYHNYDETPSREELETIVQNCFEFGAQVAKVAVQANSARDSSRVLGLYDTFHDKQLVALAMGARAAITRVAAVELGALFTFVCADVASKTAPGQLTAQDMLLIQSTMHESTP